MFLQDGVDWYKDRCIVFAVANEYLYKAPNYFSLAYNFPNTSELLDMLGGLEQKYRGWIWRKIEMSKNNTSAGMMEIAYLERNVQTMVCEHIKQIGSAEEYLSGGADFLYKIEIDNRHRLWGIRRGVTMCLIWDDPFHEFYKPRNKNYTTPGRNYKS